MALGETIKGAWAGKGKWWLIGGAAVGLGYLWWTRVRGQDPGADAGAAITPGGAAVADPIVPPGGDFSTPATPAPRPSSNGEWLQEAVASLILPPNNVGPAAAWNALNKALAGDPITNAESSIVELAIRAAGTPPEGMPRLNIASPAPAQTTGGTTSSTGGGSTSSAAVTHKVVTGDSLSGIAAGWRVSSSAVYGRNAAAIESAARAHRLSSSRGGPNNTLGWWIFPGTILTKP